MTKPFFTVIAQQGGEYVISQDIPIFKKAEDLDIRSKHVAISGDGSTILGVLCIVTDNKHELVASVYRRVDGEYQKLRTVVTLTPKPGRWDTTRIKLGLDYHGRVFTIGHPGESYQYNTALGIIEGHPWPALHLMLPGEVTPDGKYFLSVQRGCSPEVEEAGRYEIRLTEDGIKFYLEAGVAVLNKSYKGLKNNDTIGVIDERGVCLTFDGEEYRILTLKQDPPTLYLNSLRIDALNRPLVQHGVIFNNVNMYRDCFNMRAVLGGYGRTAAIMYEKLDTSTQLSIPNLVFVTFKDINELEFDIRFDATNRLSTVIRADEMFFMDVGISGDGLTAVVGTHQIQGTVSSTTRLQCFHQNPSRDFIAGEIIDLPFLSRYLPPSTGVSYTGDTIVVA